MKTIISIEKNTLRWQIAQDTLESLGNDPCSANGDYELFTDNGDLTMLTLYDDTIAANNKKIKKQESRNLMY